MKASARRDPGRRRA